MGATASKWYREYLTPELTLSSGLKRIIYTGRTAYQNVEILETFPFGRSLVLDGKTQSSELDEFVYHESLVQPALVTHTHPASVFIAGGGEGATLREVLSHTSVQRAVMVDLDKEVVDLCKRHLPRLHQGSFDDPRAEVRHVDAKRFLEETAERFDVIVIDISDPLEGGPAYLLYTQEFYRMAQERLNPGGMMAVQSGFCGPLNYRDEFTAIHKTLSTVFPHVFPYRVFMAAFGGMWGFMLASTTADPRKLSAREVDRRIASRVSRELRYYDGETHQGLFHLPKYIRTGLKKEKRVIHQDKPLFVV